MKSCVQSRQQPLLENDDGDAAWHFVSVHCDGDTVVRHQNPGKIGLAITTHLDRAAELGWSESMNKSASPRRIINTCLPAHRYNCMLMPCTSATCCRLLNAEYNAIQVHCEDARTRSKVCWKESWLPSVTFTWNIDEVNLWINISASPPPKKEIMLTLSLCSLLKKTQRILWNLCSTGYVRINVRINSSTRPVLWLWCGRLLVHYGDDILLFLACGLCSAEWWRCTQLRLSFDCQLSHLIMKSHWRQRDMTVQVKEVFFAPFQHHYLHLPYSQEQKHRH